MAERHVKTAKALLTKAQLSGQDPYLMMVEAKNIPVKNGSSPAQLLTGRRFRSVLPVAPQQLSVKPINHDAFHDQQQVMKEKQAEYFNKGTRKLPSLMEGERIRVLKGKTWKTATVIKHNVEPRSYIIKTEDGKVLRRNRRHCLKTENPIVETKEDDAEIIEISDDEEHNEVDDKDHNEVDDKDLVNIEVCNDDELRK